MRRLDNSTINIFIWISLLSHQHVIDHFISGLIFCGVQRKPHINATILICTAFESHLLSLTVINMKQNPKVLLQKTKAKCKSGFSNSKEAQETRADVGGGEGH